MKKNKIVIDNFIILSIILLIFQSPLSKMFSGSIRSIISNYDEFLAVLLFLLAILKCKIYKFQKNILVIQIIFLGIGLAGTIVNNLQPMSAVLKDLVNCSKFCFTIFGIVSFYRNYNFEVLLKKINKVILPIILIFFIFSLISLFYKLPFLQFTIKRFNIYSLQLIYYHPALLAQVLVFFISCLDFNKGKNSKYYKIMCLIMLCLTLRTKAIGFAFLYILIWNYKFILSKKSLKFIFFFVGILGMFFLTQNSIEMYYSSPERSARAKLLSNGYILANKKFPIGYGFATYGTSTASSNYSPLYEQFGFKSVYGLGYINTNYANDTFWPAIIGEFGYLGLIVFIIFILYLLRYIIIMIKLRSKYTIMCSTLLIYLLICSSSGTSFFNPISVLYALFIGLSILNVRKEMESNK